jgi:hypothetical protein
VLSAVLGALVGGGLAIVGGLVGTIATYETERGLRRFDREAVARGVARVFDFELTQRIVYLADIALVPNDV